MSHSGKLKIIYFTPGERYNKVIVPNNIEPMLGRVDIWLNHFFDVVVVSEECDLSDLVRMHNPDGILYDGLLEGTFNLDFEIKNNYAHPEIPRAGLSRVDAISPSRSICAERLIVLGAQAIFQLGDTILGEAYKDIKNFVYYIPWFFNPELFKDYKEPKRIPVGLFGNFDSATYPWRTSVKNVLLEKLSTLYFRHPGYNIDAQAENPTVLHGEKFARTLNACQVAPSSGGFTDIVISKQLEIPAARTLLVTHDVPAVREHGFEPNKNCLMADASDIVAKVKYALMHEQFLEEVTDAGFQMVHARHTHKQRPQLYQWFQLQKGLGNRRVIQSGWFKDLQVVENNSKEQTYHMMGCSYHKLLAETDAAIRERRWLDVEILSIQAIDLCDYVPEPKLRLAIACLAQGKVEEAMRVITQVVTRRINFGAKTQDPMEWAIFLLGIICSKDIESMKSQVVLFPDMTRAELNIISWIIALLINDQELAIHHADKLTNDKNNRISMHSFDNFGFKDTFEALRIILPACGLKQLSDLIEKSRSVYKI